MEFWERGRMITEKCDPIFSRFTVWVVGDDEVKDFAYLRPEPLICEVDEDVTGSEPHVEGMHERNHAPIKEEGPEFLVGRVVVVEYNLTC